MGSTCRGGLPLTPLHSILYSRCYTCKASFERVWKLLHYLDRWPFFYFCASGPGRGITFGSDRSLAPTYLSSSVRARGYGEVEYGGSREGEGDPSHREPLSLPWGAWTPDDRFKGGGFSEYQSSGPRCQLSADICQERISVRGYFDHGYK